jgi:enoyl-CoA hydratase
MLATLAHDLELDTLAVEQDDRVLLVRFCDPPHNYMTARMQKDLDILTAAVDADTRVGAAVLGHSEVMPPTAVKNSSAEVRLRPIPLPTQNSHQ